VIVVALDGTRAEGWVNEVDGVAKVEDDGFTFESPDIPGLSAQGQGGGSGGARPGPGGKGGGTGNKKPAPVGTTKNGFTKLK
jgi:hypothetical protein